MEMTPGVELTLGDGQTYVFAPLALASVQGLQKRLFAISGGVDEESIKTVTEAALHSLSRNYPGMRRQDLTGAFRESEDGGIVWDKPALIDLGNMAAILSAVMDVSGMQKKAQAEGKAQASSPPHLNGSKSIAT
jgi:hypothetical protein